MAQRPDRTTTALTEGGRFQSRLRRHLLVARLALWWERAWPLAWPIPALLALFCAIALFDLLPRLPGWLHAGLLAGFLAGLGVALFRLRRLSWPSRAEAQHRLEQDSGLPHRPLQTLNDTLAAGASDPVARVLWQVQRQRMAQLISRLAVKPPAPGLAAHDPWGLRFAPLLLLAIALAGAWHDAPERLWRAVTPTLGPLGGPAPVLQVWVTPPSYTGIAPVLLESLPSGQRLVVPTGSKVLAELQGGSGPAQLVVDDEIRPFDSLDTDSQRYEGVIAKGSHLLIRQGRRRVDAWDMAVVQDQPPTIGFASPPQKDTEGRLRLDVEGHDDYGIAKAWAIVHRADSPEAPPLIINLPLGGAHPADVRQASWHDLTGHPWAGLAVTMQPAAEDVAGQKGFGPAVTVTLPEREFTNPVARAIVEQRRVLATHPEQRRQVGERLDDIAGATDRYKGDMVVFLALSTSRSRLFHDTTPDAVPTVLDILWQTALRLEEGDRPAAQRALDQAASELERALAEGAPEAELERLMNQLQAAMEQYLQALADQAKQQGAAQQPDDPDQQVITPEELQGMLDRMRDLSRTGSRDAAQQMLSDLRQMLDGIQNGMQGGQSDAQSRQARQAMNDLDAVTRDQRKLLDETFRRNQQMPGTEQGMENENEQPSPKAQGKGKSAEQSPGQAGGKGQRQQKVQNGGDGANRQEDLRKRLGQVMQSLADLGADIPDSLGQAEQAMRESTQALRQGDTDSAVDAQTEALARLQQGSQQARQTLAKQTGRSGVTQGMGSGRDPLGRPLRGTGGIDENSVKIPDQADTQKAREVLDELRKRSGQAERPPAERDYLQRLLKQF